MESFSSYWVDSSSFDMKDSAQSYCILLLHIQSCSWELASFLKRNGETVDLGEEEVVGEWEEE